MNKRIDQLAAKAGAIDPELGVFHLNENGVDKKIAYGELLARMRVSTNAAHGSTMYYRSAQNIMTQPLNIIFQKKWDKQIIDIEAVFKVCNATFSIPPVFYFSLVNSESVQILSQPVEVPESPQPLISFILKRTIIWDNNSLMISNYTPDPDKGFFDFRPEDLLILPLPSESNSFNVEFSFPGNTLLVHECTLIGMKVSDYPLIDLTNE